MVICKLKPELSPKMSEYHSKQTLRTIYPVAFQGTAPALLCKLSTLKQLSAFSGFSMNLGFVSKMDQLFGHTDISFSEKTIEGEFNRY